MQDITNQFYLLLIYIISGVIIGILFDIFRVLRKSFRTSDFVTYIEDFLFWLLSGVFLIFIIFYFNQGQIRSYIFIGILIGLILYFVLISKIFIKINVKWITFLKKIIIKIFNVIKVPFKYLYKFFGKILGKPIHFMIINVRKFFRRIYKTTIITMKISKNNKKREKNRGK